MQQRKRFILAGLVVVATGASVAASAASLGTLTTQTLGAADAGVAACTVAGAAITYVNVYDGTGGTYNTTQVKVTGLAAGCNTLSIRAAVSNGTAAGVDSTAVAVAAGAATLVLLTPTPAKNITGVSLVVTG